MSTEIHPLPTSLVLPPVIGSDLLPAKPLVGGRGQTVQGVME
jgi:hypothetical protein